MALLLSRLWVSVAIAFLLTLFGGGPAWAQQSISQQTCSRDQTATVQPGAAAWLGGIIALNAPGTGGYGCGKPDGCKSGLVFVGQVFLVRIINLNFFQVFPQLRNIIFHASFVMGAFSIRISSINL